MMHMPLNDLLSALTNSGIREVGFLPSSQKARLRKLIELIIVGKKKYFF